VVEPVLLGSFRIARGVQVRALTSAYLCSMADFTIAGQGGQYRTVYYSKESPAHLGFLLKIVNARVDEIKKSTQLSNSPEGFFSPISRTNLSPIR